MIQPTPFSSPAPIAVWRPSYAVSPAPLAPPSPAPRRSPAMGEVSGSDVVVGLAWVGMAAMTVFAGYHGYKRNRDSMGWGLWWGLMGALVPPIPQFMALIQGYGYRVPKKKSPKKKK